MAKQRQFKATDIIVIDYETTGLLINPEAMVFAFSLTWCGSGYTEVMRNTDAGFSERMCEFWNSPCTGIAHNLKFELGFTNRMSWKINPSKQLHDTMIMHQYIDNLSPRHGLDYVATRYAGHVKEWDEADALVSKAAKIYGTYDKIPQDLMDIYQRFDGERTALIYEAMWPELRGTPAESEYWNEIELIKTTVRMEEYGFMIHEPTCRKLISWMEKELESATEQASKIAGKSINLNSVKQLNALLFDNLGFEKTEKTDKYALEELRKQKDHPILDCILKARTYKTGITVINGYLENARYDGAVHPQINTNKARTGRESSENPNMQNVSKEVKAGVKFTVPARSCFRARPKRFLILADYSGIEMRLGVQGTRSSRLYQMCADEFDFHAATAEAFYGKKFTDEQDPVMKSALRSRAKNARFAMFYGAGLARTADTLGLSIADTEKGYESDRKIFPEFYEFMESCANKAKRYGYIETFFGRRLRVAANESYAATDYCIQGSAAALFKHAQVAVDKYLKTELGDDLARCVLPVHDELVMEFDRCVLPYIDEILPLINKRMVEWPQITVPISVEYQRSMFTWDKKEKIKYAKKITA